jgi:uncharacterized protein
VPPVSTYRVAVSPPTTSVPVEPLAGSVWGTPRRWTVFAAGYAMLVTGIATSIAAGLGVGSWQVLETGLVNATGASFGAVVLAESVVCITIAWWLLGQRPWFATALLAGAGVWISALLAVLPQPEVLIAQGVLLLAGTSLIAVGVAFYLASDLGASAQDALFVGIYERWAVRPAAVRFGLDAALVIGGVALGGQFGIGTLVATLLIPALIEPALRVGHRLARTPLPPAMRRPTADLATVVVEELLDDPPRPADADR